MAPSKWDDEDDSSTPPSSPPAPAVKGVPRRSKFEDEEDDSDVVDSWDADPDSEEEREKAKVQAAARAAAEAEAAKNKKSKSQRIEEKRQEAMRRRAAEEDEESDEEETEAERRARLAREQKESDLKHAEDLFGGAGLGPKGDRTKAKPVTLKDPDDPTKSIDLSSLSIFNPSGREGFTTLRETLTPLLVNNTKKPQYVSFATDMAKGMVGELSSEQIKKIASALTTLSNVKMNEEKAAEKGGKKSKAQKQKTTLNASRNTVGSVDTNAYDDGLDEDDFM